VYVYPFPRFGGRKSNSNVFQRKAQSMRDKRVCFHPIPPKRVNESTYANQWEKKQEQRP
jgi:hypothetical protein